MTWAELFKNPEDKIVEQTYVGVYWISTVHLGLDHGMGFSNKPLIFETMVFRGPESDLDCERYATEAEAIFGHRRMEKKWAAKQPDLLTRFGWFLSDIDTKLQRKVRCVGQWRKEHEAKRHK